MDAILFYAAAALAVVSALVVIGQKNPIYSAFALIVTLCSLSVIFALLGSPFIAALQVIVYAGAIMVLFLFVLMLLNVKSEADAPNRGGRALGAVGVALVALLVAQAGAVLLRAEPGPAPAFDASTQAHGRDPVLAALPVRVRGHLDPDPGGARRGDRPRQEGRVDGPPVLRAPRRAAEPGAVRPRDARASSCAAT